METVGASQLAEASKGHKHNSGLDDMMIDAENILTHEQSQQGDRNKHVEAKGDRAVLGDISNASSLRQAPQDDLSKQNAPRHTTEPSRQKEDVESAARAVPQVESTSDPNLDYSSDIYQYLLEAEAKYVVRPDYMRNQPHLSWHMRRILVDWLSEVAQELKLQSDTLFLSVNYIDRFLELRAVVSDDLQLLGITCMWVAAKYEEVYCPTVQQCADMTAGTYSWQQLAQMEAVLLAVLDYSLTAPTAKLFQRYVAQFAPVESNDMYFLASYLLELSLLSEQFLAYRPSVVAASALHLALMMLDWPSWSEELQASTTYQPVSFKHCTIDLLGAHNAAAHGQSAVYLKWSSEAVSAVATLPGLRTICPIEAAANARW